MGFTDNNPDNRSDSISESDEEWTDEQLRQGINQLLLDHGLTKQEIQQQVQEKIDDHDFIDETAAHCLIAQDHNIQFNQELGRDIDLDLNIDSIEAGMKDVKIEVTVDTIQDTNTYQQDDDDPGEETGRVRNIVVRDDKGNKTQLTLWSDNTVIADEVSPGDHLRIEGGYTSQSDWCQKRYNCPAEIRIGSGKLLLLNNDGETDNQLL